MHLWVHYLDVFRHDAAYSWVWYSWIGNISAGVVVFFVMSLFWPRARRAIEAFAKRHVKSIHEKLDSHHEELLAQAQDHHREVIDQAEHHHREHLAALGAKPGPKRDAKGHFTK